MVSPWNHPCDETTIDYSRAKYGEIRCLCGKKWTLNPKTGWQPNPRVKYKPKGEA